MDAKKTSRVAIVRVVGCEPRQLDTIAQRITGVAPLIEIVDDEHVLVPMRGPTRYFGGEEAVAQQIFSFADSLCLSIGIADGRLAALVAARCATPLRIVPEGKSKDFLSSFPIEDLQVFSHIAPHTLSLLSRLGLGTLGKVAATHQQLLADRFGPDGEALFVLCNGYDLHLPLIEKIPPVYVAEAYYDDPLEQTGLVFAAAQELVRPIVAQLDAQGIAMCRVVVSLTTEHNDMSERVWYHPNGFGEHGLLERLRWQVTAWLEESSGLSAGVQRIMVDVQDTVRLGNEQPRLWGGRSESDQAACIAITRAVSILGEENVCVPEWRGGREPVGQYVLVPTARADIARYDANMQRVTPGALHPAQWSGDIGRYLPMMLIDPQERVEVLDLNNQVVGVTGRHLFHSEPHHVHRGGSTYRIVAWFGPWPVEERWWDPLRHRRVVRMQCVVEKSDPRRGDTQEAWLMSLEQQSWSIIGVYS